MKSVIAVTIVGILAFLGTEFNPALEMWAPLIVSAVPLLVFLMWPVRDETRDAARLVHKKAA